MNKTHFLVSISILLASFASVAAPCSYPEASMEINVKANDPTIKPLLGAPTTDVILIPNGTGCFRHFQHGSVYWNRQAGTHFVLGAIRHKWSVLGWERSFLGYPLTDETPTPDGVGRFNHFQGGSIYWHPSTGAFEVHGDIRHLWSLMGWERSVLGFPTTDELTTNDRAGRFNHFQGGSIYWKPNLGPQFVMGAIANHWYYYGFETNPDLGYPIKGEAAPKPGSPNRFSDFENGVLYWKQSTGQVSALGRFPLASRDKTDLEAEAQKQVAALIAPHGHQAYIDRAPTITRTTDYTRQGLNTVVNREVELSLRIKYKAEFLGIDGVMPDPHTDLTLWVAFRAQPASTGTQIIMTLTRSRMQTHVPFPTSGVISAETINHKLREEVLKDVLGKPQVMGTLPPSLTLLSVKVMPNGDLNTYIEPL